MGNAPSNEEETTTDRAKKIVQEVQSSLKQSIRKFDESPSANFLDTLCGPVFDDDPMKRDRSYAYSEDMSEEDSRTISDGDNSTMESSRRGNANNRKGRSTESGSVLSQSDYESEATSRDPAAQKLSDSFESEDDSYIHRKNKEIEKINVNSFQPPHASSTGGGGGMSKPLASAFAKRCYFTKAGIGKTTQHYEGLTLTGNVVLMLAAAMKLKGCPTICDEDLRRVEQTYPNQFSRLPDELLLSSGWRRISKYCHFSNKPLPDGIPFFHSKKRIHPSGGYYFLLAAAVGMVRPCDVEPLTRDTLVLLETDYPTQADAAPPLLLQDPNEWTLVDKFCFFSGGPINTEEDVYYQADFDGNPIHMLAFLSPSLTPDELYKLTQDNTDEPGLKSVAAVEEVESVYDLTERDFDDLKLYHLGPCRALPPYMLQPQAWTKVLPPHFLTAKHRALIRAQRWEEIHGPSMSMTSSAVASTNEYTYAPLSTNLPPVQVPAVLSPPAGGLPLGTPQSQGMISPGMVPAPPAFYGLQDQAVPNPQFFSESPRQKSYQAAQAAPNGFTYYHGTPPSPPTPREMISSNTESEMVTETEQQSSIDDSQSFQREVEEEGAFIDKTLPIDEAMALRSRKNKDHPTSSLRDPVSPPGYRPSDIPGNNARRDPPEDEPPSLSRSDIPDDESYQPSPTSYYTSPSQTVEASSPPTESVYSSGIELSPEKQSRGRSDYYSGEGAYPLPSENRVYHNATRSASVENDNRHGAYARDIQYQSHSYGSYRNDNQQRGDYHHVDPDYGPSVHPHYHHGDPDYGHPESHPDYHHHAVPVYGHADMHPDYHHAPPPHDFHDGPYHDQSSVGFSDDGRSEYHEAAHMAAFHGPHHGNFRSQAPEEYQGHGQNDYYRSPEADDYNNTENEPPSDRFSMGRSTAPIPAAKSEVSHGTGHSDPSQSSSTMRTAQELLRRNRAKRIDADRRKQQEQTPEDEPSVGNGWSESGSEVTSVISGSSVWTDTSSANDRSSRRALILQMAKARMKQNKASHVEDKTDGPIEEEGSSVDCSKLGTTTAVAGDATNGDEYEEDLELD